jgi:hypothetical protein
MLALKLKARAVLMSTFSFHARGRSNPEFQNRHINGIATDRPKLERAAAMPVYCGFGSCFATSFPVAEGCGKLGKTDGKRGYLLSLWYNSLTL